MRRVLNKVRAVLPEVEDPERALEGTAAVSFESPAYRTGRLNKRRNACPGRAV